MPQVRVFNLDEVKSMRDLNPKDIDTLVSIQGMIVRCSSIQPDLKQAYFECTQCQNSQQVRREPRCTSVCPIKYHRFA